MRDLILISPFGCNFKILHQTVKIQFSHGSVSSLKVIRTERLRTGLSVGYRTPKLQHRSLIFVITNPGLGRSH
jgi:hypothetical protein